MDTLSPQIQVNKIVTELKRAGVYKPEFNIVGLEGLSFNNGQFTLNKDEPDYFNDSIVVIKYNKETKKDEIIDAYGATTEAGRYYTENAINPKGCARLAFGSYSNVYKIAMHGVRAPHEALFQCGNLTVYRDLNQDFSRAGDKTETGDWFAVNIHAAVGSPGFLASIGPYSAGCQVIRSYEQQKIFMQLCHNTGFNRFSYSLFDGSAVTPDSTEPLKPAIGSIES
jgi:hypothetical protein